LRGTRRVRPGGIWGDNVKNIFECGELDENSVCSILELTAADGKKYNTKIYNLDVILSIGKSLFAFSKMEITENELLKGI